MNIEENRLNTFAEWPANAAVEPRRLARAGFYYTGLAQEVQCFLCGTKISTWNYGDFAMRRHRQNAPDCPFVCNPSSTCNVPLVPTSTTTAAPTTFSAQAGQENNIAENLPPTTIRPSQDPRVEYGTFSARLRSFTNWPIPNIVSPHDLAKAGFYYLQYEDMVECAFCRGVIYFWEAKDDPDKDHRINFPNCDFYMHQDEDDRLDLTNVKLMSGTKADFSLLGIQVRTAAKTPKYSTYEQRIRTFHNWSKEFKQSKEELARAGFYYEGYEDHVRCFHCNGGLRNWEETDDVWVEHARWFPKCEYVAFVRGQEFIRHCIENRKPLDPSIFEGIPEDDDNDVLECFAASSSAAAMPFQEVSSEIPSDDARNERISEISAEEIEISRVVDEILENSLHGEPRENSVRNQSNLSPSDVTTMLNRISIEDANRDTQEHCSKSESGGTNPEVSENKKPVTGEHGEQGEIPKESKASATNTSTEKSLDVASLEEQNRRLREARLCKICMHMEVAIVLLPCGHLSTCISCTLILTHCPMCRQEIRATVRAFFS